ncbi:LuxR C-terminal-related transcriptional regulator [Microvirga subterranea]|uniref:Two-component system nitrate/nitrite response regulator NarL n=1 Tax=Microvirga subterranea TaxID=186651 RepID=A0A370HNA2_9HYPH|nr:response regulator transcription factor [Microvirga subterranea]RDI60043.1 two-component system nitrate/nitrite response regulator NarL [Microvirga subterranea]
MLFDQFIAKQGGQQINPTSTVTLKICASPLLRAGVEEMLKNTRFIVSSEPTDLDDTAYDLLLVDAKHHPNDLASLIAAAKERHPSARVVVLADQFDLNAVMTARHAGADGFCLTTTGCDVLIHSLELVMLGEIVVPSDLILAIMGDGARKVECSHRRGPESLNGIDPPRRSLSSREIEILGWLKEGAPNKVIARKLNVAEATVKVHIKAILRKIGAGNRTQAAIWAADHLPHEAVIQ